MVAVLRDRDRGTQVSAQCYAVSETGRKREGTNCHVRHPLINKCSDIDVVAGMWIKMSNQGSVDCRQIGRQRIRHDLPQKEPNSVREERVRGGESC